MLGTFLLIILILLLVGSYPGWGYANTWGYRPIGIIGLILVFYLLLVLLGHVQIGL